MPKPLLALKGLRGLYGTISSGYTSPPVITNVSYNSGTDILTFDCTQPGYLYAVWDANPTISDAALKVGGNLIGYLTPVSGLGFIDSSGLGVAPGIYISAS